MKKAISLAMTVVLLIGLFSMAGTFTAARENTIMTTLYISPGGSDSNDGSLDKPFRSLERARAEAAKLNRNMTGDIIVYLREGTHYQGETVIFGQADSGSNGYFVRYMAYPGESPVLSGGKPVTGTWTLYDSAKNIWKVPLNRDDKLRALYVDGQRAYMANTGNFNPNKTIKAQGGWGNYVIGYVPSADEYDWRTVFEDDFNSRTAGERITVGDAQYDPYAKSGGGGGVNDRAMLRVKDYAGNRVLNIQSQTGINEDTGFTVRLDPADRYRHAVIEFDYRFGPDHRFTHEWEAFCIHGYDTAAPSGRDGNNSHYASIMVAPHQSAAGAPRIFGQVWDVGAGGAVNNIDPVTFATKGETWYRVKMMIIGGIYHSKIWERSQQEPSEWLKRDEVPAGLLGQDATLRIYAYKQNENTKIDIEIDNIKIQKGTKISAGEPTLPDWAWETDTRQDGVLFNTADVPAITRNPGDVELESKVIWNYNTIGVRELVSDGVGRTIVKFQQPYGAIAQTIGWGTILMDSDFTLYNAYEFLDTPGEFYFDRTEKMLYYIPRNGEDLNNAVVVEPRIETVVEFMGNPVVNWKNEQDKVTAGRKNITGQVQNILFDGITFSHTDWLLQKVGDSRGKASVQSCGITYTAYSTNNWHFDMYRNLALMPAAVTASHARNIHI
ncbi:MAG: hypothetical protein FWE80_08750, partial [Oscillospiraceae bacterium]|nr:hypothetical protein [Oscillospiraceae bacterium]